MTEDYLSGEDLDVLNAIADGLQNRIGIYEIQLKNGSRLTNKTPETTISFAGIDQIKEARDKIIIAGGVGKYELIMSTKLHDKRTRVGELLGMPIMADPSCPADRFLIRPTGMENSS